jgi:cytochrome c oxidase assembly factor CtaG
MRAVRRLPVLFPLLATPSAALAHAGHLHADPAGWTFDLWISGPIVLAGIAFAVGFARLWSVMEHGHAALARRGLGFIAGWLLLAGALLSPLHELGERLFVAHMNEHEILMALAAPLLVVSRPLGIMLWMLPCGARRAAGSGLRHPALVATWTFATLPLVATVLHGLAIWVWHVPVVYEAALASVTVHRLEHVSFLLTAVLFWWALVWPARGVRDYGTAVAALFATALHTGFLGILIALSPTLLYPLQSAGAAAYGIAPMDDQQLAGLVMWIPAGLVYTAAALVFAALWITGARRPGGTHALVAR